MTFFPDFFSALWNVKGEIHSTPVPQFRIAPFGKELLFLMESSLALEVRVSSFMPHLKLKALSGLKDRKP